MFNKNIAIGLIFSLAGSLFLTSANGALAQGKTPLQVLVPIAEMRTPLVEEKDLDSCIANLISNTGNILGGLTGGGSFGGAGGVLGTGCSWDSIAWFAAKALISVQFEGMKTMAQTGFFGNSSFIDNPQGYYTTINGEVTDYFFANDYANTTGMLDFVKGQARANVLEQKTTPFSQNISEGVDFPGGDAGYEAFMNDWNACPTGNGWDCWNALQSPKNDIFSVQERTAAELNRQVNEALTHTQAEVQAGQGYRDVKTDCVYGHYIGCTSITPGSSVSASMDNYLEESLTQLDSADELDEAMAPAVTTLYQTIVGWLGNMDLRNL
ncbi:MAG: hypothetical protein WCT49_00205 [Candidatus Paceibacterota bacterium]|jgi:hypothetical protein|nr:hypothetical protein [Candidatus Paceibacterota bacterium]